MTRPCELDAVEARRLIAQKKLSPVELLESCIQQIEAVDPHVNALVVKAFDRARKEAVEAENAVMRGDPLAPLHGLPVAVKDLSDTEGIVSAYGSLLYRNHVPARDEHVVAAIRRAGGIVIGKTNSPEFGAGGNTNNKLYGPTRNPFDLEKTCGGSSGGSGVVLATNMVPLATGSDTGGSLRLPAAFSGVVAHRPSPGIVPFDRRSQAFSTYQSQGPMARTVADAALLLSAMAERNAIDPMAYPLDPQQFLTLPDMDLSSLRVAVSEDLGIAPVSRAVRAAFQDRVRRFSSLFARVELRDPDFRDALDVFWYLRGVYMLAKHEAVFETYNDDVNPNVRSNVAAALKMDARKIGWAAREQYRLMQDFHRFMAEFDILICPAVTVTPFPFAELYPKEIDGAPMENYVHWAALTSSLTVTGNPVVAIPCGVDEYGTPFGIQIVGKLHRDQEVLAIAHAIEAAFKADAALSRPVPELASLKR
jgi:Asp-tRNA(Asn)/Glu-tRNA(Gln) amidotransferase A subunit family amidase